MNGESAYGPGKPYVLVIDEINRGNTSRIFGELITLIEASKRIGSDEAIRLQLPYSNDTFGVPDNLYLIGTMNTADRSLAQIDTALRRRFDFIEMMPQPQLLKYAVAGVDLRKMLEAINNRIEHLYDREHTIGHAFFMNLNEKSTIADLARIFKNKVLPLLEEYFFEDWEKIAKVLGKANIYTLRQAKGLGFDSTAKVYQRDTEKLDQPSTYIRIYDLQVAPPLAQVANE
jgi:5-methylcytosine-specific restriction protein B